MPEGDTDALFRLYAVLLLAKGADVTGRDVHDAWAAWMADRDADHAALRPYEALPSSVAQQDEVFVEAIRSAARDEGRTIFDDILFPAGIPKGDAHVEALDLYKIMVGSSEALVSRRQAVNTFFLTMNGALLTASGLIVQNASNVRLGGLAVGILATAGGILSLAWRSLIRSFGQLNAGKFKVINALERHFSVAIYAAEWEALGRGEDPNVYRSFTSREVWVPNALIGLYIVTVVAAGFVVAGVVDLG